MRRYGQFCPVAKTAEIFCQRWTALIVRDLSWGSTRFSELQRGVPLMSPSLLSQRLKTLEAEGVVTKEGSGKGARYLLTEAGRELSPLIEAMGTWGQRWTRRDLGEDEIDLDLLIWGLEAHANPTAFGKTPSVVQITFPDQPANKRTWWYLNEGDRCQLCIDDPGHEVTLWVETTVADLIRVYRGDLSIRAARDAGRLELDGARDAPDAFADWINLSPLAAIPSKRAGAAAG